MPQTRLSCVCAKSNIRLNDRPWVPRTVPELALACYPTVSIVTSFFDTVSADHGSRIFAGNNIPHQLLHQLIVGTLGMMLVSIHFDITSFLFVLVLRVHPVPLTGTNIFLWFLVLGLKLIVSKSFVLSESLRN
jgi:hypothetical protein